MSGAAARPADLARVLPAVVAFHRALARFGQPRFLLRRDSPYDRADRAAWGRLPAAVGQPLGPFIAALARCRGPFPVRERAQLIHGDLNPDNILVARQAAPALIDMAAYWRPPGFALAVLAYWLGPYKGDRTVLEAFEDVPGFPQLLVRAALRSVLVWHEFGKLGGSLEGAAADLEGPTAIVVRFAEESLRRS